MPIDFERSERSLAADGYGTSAAVLVLASVLLAAWLGWFFLGRVNVYAASASARLEVDQAVYPVDAPVEGRVVAFQLNLGQEVCPGDVLLELDTQTERLTLEEQRADLVSAKAQLKRIDDVLEAEKKVLDASRSVAGLAVAEAVARRKEAEALARVAQFKAERWQSLRELGLVSGVEDVEVQGTAEQSRAAANAEKMSANRHAHEGRRAQASQNATLARLRRDADLLVGTIKVHEASVSRLQYEIDRRIIQAPICGRLGQVSTLRLGSVVSSGQRLATVVPDGRIRAVGRFLPSDSVGRIWKDQRARIRLDGFPWTQYGWLQGTVSEAAVEPLDGNIRVELDVDPATNPRIPLMHGLPGRIEVEVERVSLATLALRAAGDWIDRPAQATETP